MTMLSPCMLTATGPGIFKTLKNTQSVDFITHGLIFRDYMVLLRPVYSHHHPWAYFQRLHGAPQTCILPSSPMGLFSEIIWCSSDLYTPIITHGLIFRDYMVLLRPVYSHRHPWAYFRRLYGAPQTCILPSSPMGLFSEIIWCSSDLYTPIITHGLIFGDYMVLLRPVYSHSPHILLLSHLIPTPCGSRAQNNRSHDRP